MKRDKLIFTMLILIYLIIATGNIYASTTVAVVDFTNNTGYRLRNIEESAAELFTTMLVNRSDFRVVERAKLKSIVTEHGFNESGLVNQAESAIELGQLLGAEYIVTGSLINIDVEETSFEGYGIKTDKVTITLDANIKVISINTGVIEVGNLYSSTNSYQGYTSHSIKVDIEGKVRSLLKTIGQNFITDLESLNTGEERVSEEIMVDFNSVPNGASIEIDGIYVGSTPATIPVLEGVRRVVISMGGYEVWDKRVKVYEGFVVNANLGKKENEDKSNND